MNIIPVVQVSNSGAQSLRFHTDMKFCVLPADCLHSIISLESSQHTARFRAGTINIGLPANTGRDNNNKTAVITTAQPNSANFVHKKNKRLSNKTLLRLVYYDNQPLVYYNDNYLS